MHNFNKFTITFQKVTMLVPKTELPKVCISRNLCNNFFHHITKIKHYVIGVCDIG